MTMSEVTKQEERTQVCHQCSKWRGKEVRLWPDEVVDHAVRFHGNRIPALLDKIFSGHPHAGYVAKEVFYDRCEEKKP
jgi:hypothetical protein